MKRSNLMVGLLSLLVVFSVAAAFKVAHTVVIPLMIAWLLSYICGPVVTFLVHKRVPLGLGSLVWHATHILSPWPTLLSS